MRQKTFFCNNCSEKIEPTGKSWSDGGRYCDVCRHDFIATAYGTKMTALMAVLCGLFGIGISWRSEKPLNVSPKQIAVISSNQNKPVNLQTVPASPNSDVLPSAQTNKFPPNTANLTAQRQPKKSDSESVESPETSYFCGAPTKKGTSCTRRVRGGGYCWQHKEQTDPTMEKLPARQ